MHVSRAVLDGDMEEEHPQVSGMSPVRARAGTQNGAYPLSGSTGQGEAIFLG